MGASSKRLKKETRVQQFREMYESGMDMFQIAFETDLDIRYVRHVMYASKILSQEKPRKRPTKEEFAEMCKTMTAGQIAEHTGAAETTVRTWIRDYDIKPVPAPRGGGIHTNRKDVDCERAYNLYMQGFKPDAIANRLGVSWQTIKTRLLENGFILSKRQGDMYCANGGVDCYHHPKYSRTCEYGGGDYCMYVCAGMGRRPCPSWDCTVYKKKDGMGLVERKFRKQKGVVLSDDDF